MAANKNISTGSFQSTSTDSGQNRHYENRIRELEAEITRLRDKLAVDEIKLNLVMSYETQYMNPQGNNESVGSLKRQLTEKDTQIGQLKKRLKREDIENSSDKSKKEQNEVVIDLLESHFQCAVCSELFIKATNLGCGHTFCFVCIDKWRKKTQSDPNLFDKRPTCPICRSEITTQAPLKTLDAFLEKAVDIFYNEDAKKQRKELVGTTVSPAPTPQTAESASTSQRFQPQAIVPNLPQGGPDVRSPPHILYYFLNRRNGSPPLIQLE